MERAAVTTRLHRITLKYRSSQTGDIETCQIAVQPDEPVEKIGNVTSKLNRKLSPAPEGATKPSEGWAGLPLPATSASAPWPCCRSRARKAKAGGSTGGFESKIFKAAIFAVLAIFMYILYDLYMTDRVPPEQEPIAALMVAVFMLMIFALWRLWPLAVQRLGCCGPWGLAAGSLVPFLVFAYFVQSYCFGC